MNLATRAFFALASSLLLSPLAHAYYAVLDDGEILPPNQFKFTGDFQLLTDEGGLNVGARAEASFKEEFGAKVLLGTGATDVFAGGFFKWMPIPDIQGQPAIGLNLGLIYARAKGNRDLTTRVEPLISKRFNVDGLEWTPYGSIPIGFRDRDNAMVENHTDLAFQLVGGTQLQIPNLKNLQFIGEFGVDLGHALSHVAFGVVYYLDTQKGPVLQ